MQNRVNKRLPQKNLVMANMAINRRNIILQELLKVGTSKLGCLEVGLVLVMGRKKVVCDDRWNFRRIYRVVG